MILRKRVGESRKDFVATRASIASSTFACMTSSMPTTPCIGVRNSCDRLGAYGFKGCAKMGDAGADAGRR